jgi:AhpD family alkylhydroperoxidase
MGGVMKLDRTLCSSTGQDAQDGSTPGLCRFGRTLPPFDDAQDGRVLDCLVRTRLRAAQDGYTNNGVSEMTRAEVHREMEEMFGLVPTFVTTIPDEFLSQEWELWKQLDLGNTHIPGKYKELIGLAVAAAEKCPFCAAYHTEGARVQGATEEEIEEAVHIAKLTAGWSIYLHGMQVDQGQFHRELRMMMEHVRGREEQRKAA